MPGEADGVDSFVPREADGGPTCGYTAGLFGDCVLFSN